MARTHMSSPDSATRVVFSSHAARVPPPQSGERGCTRHMPSPCQLRRIATMWLQLLPGWHRYVRRRLYVGDTQTMPLNYSPFSRFSMLTRGVSDGRHEKRKPSTDISQRTMNVDHLLRG